MKTLLFTRPEHDDTTHYISKWSKEAVDFASSKGMRVLDLNRERANRKEVISMISKQKPGMVIFNGHGADNKVFGHRNEPLVVAGENEGVLKGSMVYSLSCRSAKVLGLRSVKKGAKAYIGYDEDFIFVFDPKKITFPLNDEAAKMFLEPSNELVLSLIKGNSAEESHRRSQELFQRNLRKLLSSEASPEDSSMARYLWWDMKHQVCVGIKDASF